jgi:hypothetical protein
MKTKINTESEKSLLEQIRAIRDKLSNEMMDLSFDEIKAFLDKKKNLHPEIWKKATE